MTLKGNYVAQYTPSGAAQALFGLPDDSGGGRFVVKQR